MQRILCEKIYKYLKNIQYSLKYYLKDGTELYLCFVYSDVVIKI